MLQVLLLILKILLWIILGILGLSILLLLLVLFAPIKYTVDAEYYGKAKVKAKISYLIVSVKILFNQETNQNDTEIRICGILLKPKDKTKKAIEEDGEKQDDSAVKETEEDIAENNIDDIEEDITDSSTHKIVEDTVNEDFDLWDNEDDIVPPKEKKLVVRILLFFKGLFQKFFGFIKFIFSLNPDKIADFVDSKTKNIRIKINRFKKFWDLKCTVKTRAYLKKYIPGVVKHVAPRKIKGHIHFGFDEPYKTGQIIGYMSMLPIVYQKKLEWEPDFYNKVLEGDIYLKGKIRIGYIARIVLNINIWKTIKVSKKIMS